MFFTEVFFLLEFFQAKPQLFKSQGKGEDFRQYRKFMTQVLYNSVTFSPSYCNTYITHIRVQD